ncbi:MAG: HAMP domain-containing protein [Armatimonadetes bacterium]|nr:HAMP domain-containing protein [Armatimonadota bacterium]
MNSIRTRLIFWIVGVMAFVLAVMGVILRYTLEAHLLASFDNDLARMGRMMAIQTERHWAGPRIQWPRLDPAKLKKMMAEEAKMQKSDPFIRYRPRILSPKGRSLFPLSKDTSWNPQLLALSVAGQEAHQTVYAGREPIRIFSIPVFHKGKVVAVIQTAYSLSDMYRNLSGLLYTFLVLIPVALLVTGTSAAFLSRRLLAPVRHITQTAAHIGSADLSRRLSVRGKDEFAEMASTFNAMLDRLEQAFEQQRRFTADASHELKTPLTAIKAHTSLTLSGEKTPAEYRRALERADKAATLMIRIVQDLLLLARSDANQLHPDLQPVSIREALAVSADTYQGSGHPAIDLRLPEPDMKAVGDVALLTRLFNNLLDNAVRYTPPDGRITVSACGNGSYLTVTVSDTGIGVSPEHLPHLCERFYRVDEARTRKQGGTGLGLAICRSIVESHHGSLILDSAPGQGMTARVTLPQAG